MEKRIVVSIVVTTLNGVCVTAYNEKNKPLDQYKYRKGKLVYEK